MRVLICFLLLACAGCGGLCTCTTSSTTNLAVADSVGVMNEAGLPIELPTPGPSQDEGD